MSEPRNIYIGRHGHREDFLGDSWIETWQQTALRPYDPGLSGIGVAQAKQLGQRLQGLNVSYIFASPFLRTLETAHYVAEALQLPVKIEEGICEWLHPRWFQTDPDFLNLSEARTKFPHIDIEYKSRLRRTYPEYDEKTDVWPKIGPLIHTLMEQFEGGLLFIGHGSSVTGIARALGGPDVKIIRKTCSLIHFVQQDRQWHMLLNGCTNHLSVTEHTVRLG